MKRQRNTFFFFLIDPRSIDATRRYGEGRQNSRTTQVVKFRMRSWVFAKTAFFRHGRNQVFNLFICYWRRPRWVCCRICCGIVCLMREILRCNGRVYGYKSRLEWGCGVTACLMLRCSADLIPEERAGQGSQGRCIENDGQQSQPISQHQKWQNNLHCSFVPRSKFTEKGYSFPQQPKQY